jgi:dTDP-glucose pyrophosphorylase
MNDWRKTIVQPNYGIKDALKVINDTSARIALVVDKDGGLLGTLTDGDIRRGLLGGCELDTKVDKLMSRTPKISSPHQSRSEVLCIMNEGGILHLPIIDSDKCLVGLHVLSELLENRRHSNWIVLMAGGEGRRLHPVTLNTPKPMLRVGDKPLLETIINSFLEQGFRRFFISVNYLSEKIKNYFGDGSAFGAEIVYLQETEKLGTAGCLGMLPQGPDEPIFVMNADILTRVNFEALLDYHKEDDSIATVCVRDYSIRVPFGVVDNQGSRLSKIVEKPVKKFLINAGIYVLSPQCLRMISSTESLDMTTLLAKLIADGERVQTFPIHEYWMDIGRVDDLDRAHIDFGTYFEN